MLEALELKYLDLWQHQARFSTLNWFTSDFGIDIIAVDDANVIAAKVENLLLS